MGYGTGYINTSFVFTLGERVINVNHAWSEVIWILSRIDKPWSMRVTPDCVFVYIQGA